MQEAKPPNPCDILAQASHQRLLCCPGEGEIGGGWRLGETQGDEGRVTDRRRDVETDRQTETGKQMLDEYERNV